MHLASLLLLTTLVAADGNVEWNGLSHVGSVDRRPLVPVAGEAFQVRFQSYAGDLTAARVQVDDGAVQWVDAAVVAQRGPYDVWAAAVPATAASGLSYWIEVSDGADTDYLSVGGVSEGAPADGGWILDFTTLAHAPVGATPTSGGGTVFKVWAPTRATAYVRGAFNGWGLANPMQKVGEHFIELVPSTTPRQQYKYYFNNSVWNADARGRGLDPSNNLNTFLEDPFGYAWQVGDFPVPPQEEMVIYQLHVGTFCGRNDPLGPTVFPSRYVDVAARVGHLVDLGVNAVMLNPITEFAGDISAGYNPISQWAPEWKYGTPDELKYLVDTLHQNGIAVLLDIVWNHFSPTDNFLWNYDGSQIYFDDPATDTPWGSQADFSVDEVRGYFLDSALLWLEEYRMDGFRMDATDFMEEGANAGWGWTLMQALNDLADRRHVDKVLLAEQLPDDAYVTRPTSLGGAGFDAQYHDHFTDRLREEIDRASFGDPQIFVLSGLVNGSGGYLSGRFVVNYLELHDEAWQESGGQRFVKTIDPTFPHDDAYAKGRTKLGQGLVLTAPGIPALVQGTEWLEDTDWGPGFADRIDWSHKTTYAGIFRYYQDLIALRTSLPALRADAPHQVFHVNDSANVMAFQRYDGAGQVLVVVLGLSNSDFPVYRVGVPQAGSWKVLLHSQDTLYEGPGHGNPPTLSTDATPRDGFGQSLELDLPAMSLVVLEKVEDGTPAPEVGVRGSAAWLAGSRPNPASGRTHISFGQARPGFVQLTVHDLAGRRVRTLMAEERPAGSWTVQWDGRDGDGRSVASGVYTVVLEAADQRIGRKTTLLR